MSDCGCGSTVSAPFSPSQVRQMAYSATAIITGDCEYTNELLTEWKRLLECIKSKNTFDIFNTNYVKVNSYLGIVQSAINYKTYPCYFIQQLDKMKGLIESIKNSGKF